MKKIFTFLFCSAILSSAFAQPGRNWDDRNSNVVYGNSNQKSYQYSNDKFNKSDKGYNAVNSHSIFQRDREIQKINSKYDFQVQQVLNNRFFTRKQKRNIISTLKSQKDQDINIVNCAYSDANAYNDKYQQKNRHDGDWHGR